MSVKEKLRKIPFLFCVLSFAKNKIYLPLKRGHVAYYIKYSFAQKADDIKKLKEHGFESVKPFAPFTWRIGKGRDNAYRRYYKANFGSNLCFIKVGKNDSTVRNEAEIYRALKEKHIDFIAKPLCIDLEFDQNTVMVANEFVEDMHSITEIQSLDDFKTVCMSFGRVLDELKVHNVIHADIHKGNMMLAPQNRIILLDFGISIINKTQKQVDYRSRPGTFYRNSEDGKRRVYDDAYSFVMMFESLKLPENFKKTEEFKAIENKIDAYSVEVGL